MAEEQDKPREYAPKLFISKAELSREKSIRDVKIDLHDGLNIIIGENGAGKSNFLTFFYEAINFSDKLRPFNKASFNINKINESAYQLKISGKGTQYGGHEGEVITIFDSNLSYEIYQNEKKIEDGIDNGTLINSYSRYDIIFTCQLIKHGIPYRTPFIDTPFQFELTSYTNHAYSYQSNLSPLVFEKEYPYFLKSTFLDLEIYLLKIPITGITRELIKEQLDIIYSIKEYLREYSPIEDIEISDDFNIHKDEKGTITINNLFLRYKINNQWLPFSSLSDGTKRLFYIITEIAFPSHARFFHKGFGRNAREANRIILLEEPELGIHPHQLNKLMDFIREQSKHKQIIITTHSPQVLDILKKDELDRIIIADIGNDGTWLRHLNEKEKKKASIFMEDKGFLSDYWRFSDLNK